MKKILGLVFLVLLLGGYSYWFIYQAEKQKNQDQELAPLFKRELLSQIYVGNEFGQVRIEERQGLWWVIEPHVYLADQERVEKFVGIMAQTEPREEFALEEDLYGFDPGRAFFELQFKNQERSRWVVGSEKAPAGGLYVLNKDTKKISVFHNVWGQFLYYPAREYFHKTLPIPGQQVKSIEFHSLKGQVWSVRSKGKSEIDLLFKGKHYSVKKSEFLWFFNRLREFRLENHQFKKDQVNKEGVSLVIEVEKGNITFVFDEKAGKIFIPSVNVFADFDSFSLKSLNQELEKVIKNDKK